MSLPCTQENPCCCIVPCSLPQPPKCPSSKQECCLIACNEVLPCADSIGPCGQVGTTDLSQLNHNITGCNGPEHVKYSIVEYDRDVFVSVTIDRNTGVLTWVTGGPEHVGKFGDVCYALECVAREDCADECIGLKSEGIIHIGIKDLCIAHSCQECEHCDPCSGECLNDDTNLLVGENEQHSNLSVNPKCNG